MIGAISNVRSNGKSRRGHTRDHEFARRLDIAQRGASVRGIADKERNVASHLLGPDLGLPP